MELSGQRDNLDRRQARQVSVNSRAEKKKLSHKLHYLESHYRHTADKTDQEASRMKEKAKDLLLEQLRLADQLPEGQKLRENLGLTRRRSSIKPMEVLTTAERLRIPGAELQKRHSVAGLTRKDVSLNKDETPETAEVVTDLVRKKPAQKLSNMPSFKSPHRSGGSGLSRETGGAHYCQSRRMCCSVDVEKEIGGEDRMYSELARCRYLRTSVDSELSVDEVFSKN